MRLFHNKSRAASVRAIGLASLLLVAACSKSPEERANGYYEKGAKYLSQKDYVKADIEFKNAVQANASHIAAWRGLAQVEETKQDRRGLVPILRKIVELDAHDIDSTLKLSQLLVLGNASDDALKLVDAVLDANPRNASARALKAGILMRKGDNAGALKEAENALRDQPGFADALMVVAAERSSRGDIKGALAALDSAAADAGNVSAIDLFKIKLYADAGDLAQVEALLRKLIALNPKEIVFRERLVGVYIVQKRLDDAEKELRAVTEAFPANIAYGLNLVRFLNTYRTAAVARAELQQKIERSAKPLPYQIALAEFDFMSGDADRGQQFLEQLLPRLSSSEDIIAVQTKLAEMYHSAKKVGAAEKLISEVLQKDGRNLGALRLRATVRLERGQLDSAISDLRQILNDQPRATDVMLLLATAYERSGSIALAEKQYSEVSRASGFDVQPTLAYVSFLQRRGSSDRAGDVLDELAARRPNDLRVLTALAASKLERRDWTAAEQVASLISRLGSGQQSVADQILGESLSGQNKLEQSIQVLESAYAATPGAAQPMAALVRAYLRAKQNDRAIGFLQETLKKAPDNVDAMVLLGSTQLFSGQRDQAEKSFKSAIQKQPKAVSAYIALANLYSQQKDIEKAAAILRAGLEEVPTNFSLRMSLAGILELKRDYEAAIAQYESLIKDEPGSLIVANNLASLLTDVRVDKASLDRAATLVASLQKSPVSYFKDTIGWVQYRRGELKPAIELLQQAANELPTSALVRYHLGVAYMAAGEVANGNEQLKRAQDLAVNDDFVLEKIRAAQKGAGG
jgi:predicted Zn-dependent protease